jgi:hypothetical protein
MTTETTDPADETVSMKRSELRELVASAVATATQKAPEPPPLKKATEMTQQEWKAARDTLRIYGRVAGTSAPATAPATAPAASSPPPPAAPVKDARQMSPADWVRARRDLKFGRIA